MKKLKERLLSFITVFIMILGTFPGTAVSAYAENVSPPGRDITDKIVTSFEVTPNRIENVSPVTVNLTFLEEKGDEIQPGDFIQVTWTYKPNEVYFEGFQEKKELYHNGIHMADLKVVEDKATIVFTEAVKSLDNISGSAEFSLKGWNLRQIEEVESWDKATVQCGSSTKNVEIHTVKAGEPTFFDKTGTIYEDSSFFNQIHANNNFLDSVKITHENGSESPKYEMWETVRINYNWSLKTHKKGDIIRFKLPKEFQLINDMDFELNIKNNTRLGRVHATTDGNVTIELDDPTDYISKHNQIKGTLFFEVRFNTKYIKANKKIL